MWDVVKMLVQYYEKCFMACSSLIDHFVSLYCNVCFVNLYCNLCVCVCIHAHVFM